MSEDRNRGSRDFSQYDSMTTEDLEEILRLDAEAPMEQESDTELILYVMEVLANRNTKDTGKTVQESWESFQQHYLLSEKERLEHTPEIEKRDRSSRSWLRRSIAAAAAIVLILCIPLTAKAFEWKDIWNVVAKWAKETFSFVRDENVGINAPVSDDDIKYTSLQDLLKRNNRSYDMVPVWIPDGYVLEKAEKDIMPIQEIYSALYRNGEKYLRIGVISYIDADPEKIEINEDILEIYEISGMQFYIFSNVDQIQAIWYTESCECYISGDLEIDEVKMMINSIKKG